MGFPVYDYRSDPDALRNLIGDPRYRVETLRLRRLLLKHMESTADPLLARFQQQMFRDPLP